MRVRALRVTRQAVVGDLLPRGRIRHELARARPDPRIAVERAQTHRHTLGIARIAAVQRRAALPAEPLLKAALRFPRAQALLAAHHAKRYALRTRVGRRSRAAATLTARAMAVARRLQRSRHLEAHRTAAAAAAQGQLGRGSGHAPHHSARSVYGRPSRPIARAAPRRPPAAGTLLINGNLSTRHPSPQLRQHVPARGSPDRRPGQDRSARLPLPADRGSRRARPGRHRLRPPQLDPARTAISQIRALGLDPRDVRHILLTHLDLDHAGGLPDFPHADVHLLGRELAAASKPRWNERPRYVAAHWSHGPRWVQHEARGEQWFGFDSVRPLPNSDDEILLVPLPGHTFGHTGVAIRRSDRWLLHCGDAYFHHGLVQTPPHCPVGLRLVEAFDEVDRAARPHNIEPRRRPAPPPP